jgi:hypothetical protein
MIGDTIGLTYNTVAKTLNKINQDGYGAEYYLDDAANNMRFSMSIKHTIPERGKAGESHLVRLDVEQYDSATGEYSHMSSAWCVIKTSDAPQVAADVDYTAQALVDFLTDANIDKVIARES